jgi:PAS domain S-box-containing protein
MGRRLDDARLAALVGQVRVDFQLTPVRDQGLPEDRPALIQRLARTGASETRAEASSLVLSTLFDDIWGKPALLLEARIPRSISTRGAAALRFAFGSVLSVGLVLILAMLLFLETLIVRPLRGLTTHISAIGAHGDLKLRLGSKRRDEVGMLAHEFDTMLDRLERDNRQREEAEAAVRNSEALFRATIEATGEGLLVVDQEGRITHYNQCLVEMLELPDDLMAKRDFAEVSQFLSGHLEGGIAPKMDDVETLRFTDGRIIERYAVPLIREGEVAGQVYNFQDVTERETSAHRLAQHADQLELANRRLRESTAQAEQLALEAQAATVAKGSFLANMSHEIRTPLNGVIGMTGLLFDTPLDETQREYAQIIQSSADILLALLNDILDYSKMEAGKLTLETIDFDLRALMEEVLEISCVKTEEKGLELACLVHHDVPSLLRGDPGRLRQVLLNLVGNAGKFTYQGEVVIRAKLVEETEHEATIRFEVQDTGIGIPADRVDYLFQSFSQVDSSTTRKYGGTGLGLAICKQIVEQMGGEIGVESVPDKGSTFHFLIPLAKQPKETQRPLPPPESLAGRRILIVDDNATNRFVLREMLYHQGCEVSDAGNGTEAMHLLREAAAAGQPYDLAILDMMMPEIDGETLGRNIQADPAIAGTLLVMLTSIGERGDAVRLKEAGFTSYLTKPVRGSQLYQCLGMALGLRDSGADTKKAPLVTVHTLAEHRRRLRVLVAEDNVVNQMVALKILEKLGCLGEAVSNGQEALDALERGGYDLVLMDIQMPEMDGIAATQAIRERESVSGAHIPIIAMTAHAMAGDRERCLGAGMDNYVSKPVRAPELAEKIDKVIALGARE